MHSKPKLAQPHQQLLICFLGAGHWLHDEAARLGAFQPVHSTHCIAIDPLLGLWLGLQHLPKVG